MVKLHTTRDPILCPTQTFRTLLQKFVLKPSDPLIVLDDYTLLSQTLLGRRLATFDLDFMVFFIMFMGATIAYDANISLTAIKIHWVWNSDAIWSYISDNTSQPLKVPLAF